MTVKTKTLIVNIDNYHLKNNEMKNLSAKIQNKKGNEPKYIENLGFMTAFLRHDEDIIIIDDFQGSGENYKQRELTEIRVYHNGKLIFEGDKYDFFEQLKK